LRLLVVALLEAGFRSFSATESLEVFNDLSLLVQVVDLILFLVYQQLVVVGLHIKTALGVGQDLLDLVCGERLEPLLLHFELLGSWAYDSASYSPTCACFCLKGHVADCPRTEPVEGHLASVFRFLARSHSRCFLHLEDRGSACLDVGCSWWLLHQSGGESRRGVGVKLDFGYRRSASGSLANR